LNKDLHTILKQYWGFEGFRPLQEEIINAVLEGKDALALMPTGGGKSLCYQLPAMALDGLCLVISPLIALMKDQVENLRRKNITAFAIYSGMSRKEVINTLRTATESNCKFLYVSPERLESRLFLEYLPALPVSLIAVDEAHCISQWGYDFRPPYLRIAALREELSGIPVLALTASATKTVQEDICDKLNFRERHIFRQSFERPNLSYSSFKVGARINKILEILEKVAGSSIVYCKSRKKTREISDLLQLNNISANYYHAGLTQEVRNQRQEDWLHSRTRVIVCTNAFGMGIDKPDVRTVIHADAPECLENYYQEAGRAGRDGKTSFAVLLYEEKDLEELEKMAALRFPSIDQIREVYQAVANYLQLPTGTGQGEYYDFDLSDLVKKFKLSTYQVLYSLKALEQDGWLSFNEQVYLPATIIFTVEKDRLYSFEKENPVLEPIIKILLRSYEGIYDRPTFISEKVIAGLLRKDLEEVKQQLMELQRYGIIEYRPQKDKPQVLFLRDRIKAEDLYIDLRAYEQRKNQAIGRIGQMIDFILEELECRSVIIGNYFGDSEMRPCGICDNCLRKRSVKLSKEDFEMLSHRIINIVKYESLGPRELFQKLNSGNKEKAWKVLEFLQAENKIEIDKAGLIRLK
jgi:ATP-dependent DNA helicase RecQ